VRPRLLATARCGISRTRLRLLRQRALGCYPLLYTPSSPRTRSSAYRVLPPPPPHAARYLHTLRFTPLRCCYACLARSTLPSRYTHRNCYGLRTPGRDSHPIYHLPVATTSTRRGSGHRTRRVPAFLVRALRRVAPTRHACCTAGSLRLRASTGCRTFRAPARRRPLHRASQNVYITPPFRAPPPYHCTVCALP